MSLLFWVVETVTVQFYMFYGKFFSKWLGLAYLISLDLSKLLNHGDQQILSDGFTALVLNWEKKAEWLSIGKTLEVSSLNPVIA